MQLLEHFKELTVHPKNAQELKGLILQLAIQGKLTQKWRVLRQAQEPPVESATVLLEKIKAEKEQLIKDKKIKKEKPLPEITAEEIPFELPESWTWCRLGEIGTTNVGLTYKPAHISDNGIPVLRSSNIQNSTICLNDLVRVNTDYREKDTIGEGDLLICARNGSRNLVGKCAIVESVEEVMVFGAFMAIFRSKFNQYLKLFIQSPQYRARLDGVETTTINQITQGNLKATEIPLPPLEEQKAIVSIVNQLFKEVEELEAKTKERVKLKEDFVRSALRQLAEAKEVNGEWQYLQQQFKAFFNTKDAVKKLRECILKLAVQGKLTHHWRVLRQAQEAPVEPASVLLGKIKAEKKQLIKDKKIKKEKALPDITEDEVPYELPEGWTWCRFQEIMIEIKGGSTPSKANSLFWGGHIPWASVKDLKDFRYLTRTQDTITELGLEKCSSNIISENSLIICTRMGLGKITINTIPIAINQDLKAVTLSPNVLIEYIYDQYKTKVIKGSGMTVAGIKQDELLQLLIALPPLEEQKAIVAKVNSLMALCDQLELEIEKNTKQAEDLMQSCLKEIFEN